MTNGELQWLNSPLETEKTSQRDLWFSPTFLDILFVLYKKWYRWYRCQVDKVRIMGQDLVPGPSCPWALCAN
jgi:hypothetical protein